MVVTKCTLVTCQGRRSIRLDDNLIEQIEKWVDTLSYCVVAKYPLAGF